MGGRGTIVLIGAETIKTDQVFRMGQLLLQLLELVLLLVGVVAREPGRERAKSE